MKNCKRIGCHLLCLALIFALNLQAWAITGTVTDNRISAGGSTVMVFAIPHQTQMDPYLAEVECLAPVSGTYPNYTFDLPCGSSGSYDIGVISWDGSLDQPPSFVTDVKLNLPYDTSGISLTIQPNSDHLNGDLYDINSGLPISQPAEIWAFDQSNNLVGIAFCDTSGHYDFGYLPGGGGPYDLVARASGYWEDVAVNVNNPGVESFVLRNAFTVQITSTQNSGYNYDYIQHPDRINWILADAINYRLTLEITNSKSLPIDQVTIRLPGGAWSASKFQANSSAAAHTVGPGLDWDSVWVDQNGVQDKIFFTQGSGVEVIKAEDTSEFTVEVASMQNVSFDNFSGIEVIVFKQGGGKRAYAEAGVVQKILRISDLSFFPPEVDSSNQTGPGSTVTVTATVENHGTVTFVPYDNWSNIWSTAFVTPGTKIPLGSISPAGSSALAYLDFQVTGSQGTYQVNCFVSDSGNQNTSSMPFEESLVVNSTGVGDEPTGPLPKSFLLRQNFPNPFNASTRIDYSLAAGGSVSLEIYNILGQRVRTLVCESQPAGAKSISWDGEDNRGEALPTGMYFYRLQTSTVSFTKKMTLIR